MTACAQPGCTGTIADSYCDVCGSPAGAPPFVPAGMAALVATPVSAEKAGPAAVGPGERFLPRMINDRLTMACQQPGCTGTMVDGYCDVCGSPVGARPFVPAETIASTALPAPAGETGATAVRRALVVAAVLSLLACPIVLHKMGPGFLKSGSRPTTAAGSASTTVGTQSAGRGGVPPSHPSPASDARNGSAQGQSIQLKDVAGSAKRFETVRIEGKYPGGIETFVRVQRWDGEKWAAFPVPTKTDQSGKFTAYVEFEQPGRYKLRVLHPGTGATSDSFLLVIKG